MKIRSKSRPISKSKGTGRTEKRSKNKKKKKNGLPKKGSYVAKLTGAKPGWLLTREEDQQDMQHRKKAEQQANRRAPEFFLFDGDSKTIRIVQFLGAVERYSVRISGKWRQVTAPAYGEPDLFRDKLGVSPSARYIYEVIDIDGYTDKQGKEHSELRRFWVVPQKIHDNLEAIRQKRGDLDTYDLDISRSGTGQHTTYQLMPDMPSKFKKSWSAQDSIAEQLEDFYSPPSEDEQRQLLGMVDDDS